MKQSNKGCNEKKNKVIEKKYLLICKRRKNIFTFVRYRIVEELRGLEFFCFFMVNIENRTIE